MLNPAAIKLNSKELEDKNDQLGQQNFGDSDKDLIDKSIYDSLLKYASGHELLDLYREFEIETKDHIDSLQIHIEQKNITETLSILHCIKGTSASLGLWELADFAEKSEKSVRSNEFMLEDDFLIKLLEIFSKFTDNYERLLKIW